MFNEKLLLPSFEQNSKLFTAEIEKTIDFFLTAIEILDAEGVNGDFGDPHVETGFQHGRQSLETGQMTRGTGDLMEAIESCKKWSNNACRHKPSEA